MKNLYQNQFYGHYDSILKTGKTIRSKGFNFNKEEEVDKLAIEFIKNLGLDPKGYLKPFLLR